MKTLTSLLYRKGVLKFNLKSISKWVKTNNSEKLALALQYGIFDIRKAAIEGLTLLEHKESVSLFEELLNDPVQPVSEAAMKGLKSLTGSINSDINQKIKDKKDYWKSKKINDRKSKSASHISNLSFSTQEKESSGRRLEKRFKQQRNANQPPYGF